MKLSQTIQRSLFFAALIILITGSSFIFFHPDAQQWFIRNGIGYGYIGVFVLAFIGGTSTFFPIPYWLGVIALSGLGFNPLLLGICAGLGASIGDTVSYFIGYHGQTFFSQTLQSKFSVIHSMITRWPKLTPLFLFLYGALIPLPDDIVIIPLGMIRHNYFRTILPVCLGKIVLNTNLALTGKLVL